MKTLYLLSFLLILFSFSCSTKQEIAPQPTKSLNKAARIGLLEDQYKTPDAIFFKHVGSIKVQGMYIGKPEIPSVDVEGIIEQLKAGDVIFSAVTEDGIKHHLTTADFKAVFVFDAFNNSVDAYGTPLVMPNDTLQGGMTAYAVHPRMGTVVVYYENDGNNTLQVKETLTSEAELAQVAQEGIYMGTDRLNYQYNLKLTQSQVGTVSYFLSYSLNNSPWTELWSVGFNNATLKEVFTLDFNDCWFMDSRCSETYAIIEEYGTMKLHIITSPSGNLKLLANNFNIFQVPPQK